MLFSEVFIPPAVRTSTIIKWKEYYFRILKLLNQRKLEAFKEKWWNKNPNKKSCEEFEEDSGGGISIYNIGNYFESYTLNHKNFITNYLISVRFKLFINRSVTGGVFIVIFVGIGLAILTLVFEYVYYKDKKQSRVSSATGDTQMKIPVQVQGFDKEHDETKAYVPIS